MTGRDRIVLMVVCVLAVLGAAWVLVVSPERKQASKLEAQVSAAKTQLEGAQGELSHARAAQAQYAAAYSSIVSLGKAVPAAQEVPSLIYQLSQATHQQNVEFASIATAAPATPAAGASAASTAAASFAPMPFTFVFNGSFFSLEHLFRTLTGFTNRTSSDALEVKGRLLTIQSLKLSPEVAGSAAGPTKGQLSGTITATAYQLPAGQGVTGGATPSSPAGTGAAPASTTASSSAATAPAVARVTP
jgi:hypothetical protein